MKYQLFLCACLFACFIVGVICLVLSKGIICFWAIWRVVCFEVFIYCLFVCVLAYLFVCLFVLF